MKVTDKIFNFRINPYIQEAVLQFIIDVIVIGLVTVVFVIADFPVIACVLVDLAYFIVAVIFYYKVLIQAIIDKNKRDYITEKKVLSTLMKNILLQVTVWVTVTYDFSIQRKCRWVNTN